MPTSLPAPSAQRSADIRQVVAPYAWLFVAILALVSLVLKFAPLPENFATFGALSLFCGLFLRGPARWFVPLAVLFAADCVGHFANEPSLGFYHVPAMILNYVGFALFSTVGVALNGWWQRRALSTSAEFATLPVGALIGSLLFYAASNFGAWLDPRMGYAKTIEGLQQCYLMGLPFLRSTLASDVLFSLGFVAVAWAVAHQLSAKTRGMSTN